ncbi:unnamed protein product [Cylicocyclus nassatus]|uniref:Uncharacterized protein n=1 Tax=Cylicocyclus nassatus TaxID=53992 RepID=A0AA36HGD5_CYLNA|nr:unnamed protein product [Cylicocyclus nassatus]
MHRLRSIVRGPATAHDVLASPELTHHRRRSLRLRQPTLSRSNRPQRICRRRAACPPASTYSLANAACLLESRPGRRQIYFVAFETIFLFQGCPVTMTSILEGPWTGMGYLLNRWIRPQEDITTSFEDIQYGDMQTVNQQILTTGDEIYLMPDEERDFNEMTESVESLQVAAHEVVVDEMMQPQVEPTEYIQSLPRQVVRGMPTYVRSLPQHAVRPEPSQIMPMAGSSRVRYIVQQQPQPYEVPQNAHIQYEMRPKAMFEGTSSQPVIPVQQRPPTVTRSRSKSQPRRPIYGDLEDDSLAYLVQEYDEGEWDGVELEDHEYFVGERSAIMADDDEGGGAGLPALKMQQRPYFPPNLSPTEKKEYLLVNYKKACERYFPFANIEMLEADTIYKPVEAFASDLYRFHSRGAHIHGFFRTVIDTRDPPSHDQTRYIQDIQFGKVFPLFPDYEEWDDKMRDEFRQLTSRLLRLFERKYFYASAGGGVGKAPIVKRGPKPQPKPPPDYAEQQKVRPKGIPKGFQAVRASSIPQRIGQPKPMSQATLISHPVAAATRLTQIPQQPPLTEMVPVPDEVGAARVQAFEHNKRADIKRLVNDAFVNREQEAPSYVEYEARPSDPRTFICRVPPGPSKTLRHQRSTGSKAMRMIHNRTIEPSIDPETGRYVVNLDDIRGQPAIPDAADVSRYVHRPVHSLREMADSARRGAANYATAQAIVRPQGARVSRIDQAPRFNYNSATSMAQQHHVSSSSMPGRAPLLRTVAGITAPRMSESVTGNVVSLQNGVTRSEHVYPRSHSSGRTAQPAASAYRRSASSGRPVETVLDTQHDDIDGEPYIQVDDDSNDAPISIGQNNIADVHISRSRDKMLGVSNQNRSHESDQNSAPSASDVKNQKRTVLLRDEKGRLRRGIKLPDGTILLRVLDDKTSMEARPREPTAGGVYAMHSMSRSDEKKLVRRGDQWKRIQAPISPWSRPQEEELRTDVRDLESAYAKVRSRRKEPVRSEEDDDLVLVAEGRQSRLTKKNDNVSNRRARRSKSEAASGGGSAPRSRSQRRPRCLARHCPVSEVVPHRVPLWSEEKLQTFLRNRLRKQEEEDGENIYVDVVSTDDAIEASIRELIASAPPPATNGFFDQGDVNDSSRERKKAGRPHKKFRGRLAKQKQAIRDAEIAEKVAIKHRELPVLDLALKVIDDPTVEVPVEVPPILLDPQIAIDANILHEVGEVLKEIVAQISLEELEPKRDIKSRSRRSWDYLPERVRSKRQEYRNLNVPVNERSPPPPPLRSKPRGRNSEKYRKAIAERQHNYDHDGSPNVGLAANVVSKVLGSVEETRKQTSESGVSAPQFAAMLEQSEREPQKASLISAEEPINDEDLVDVNVDTFFSDALTTSNSGDEDETQSQKLQKWQKSISDVTLTTPGASPSKSKRLELEKSVCEREIVVSELPKASDLTPSPAVLAVEALITLVASGSTSAEEKPLNDFKEADVLCSGGPLNAEESEDVCQRVETMLDALQVSFETTASVSSKLQSGTNASSNECLPYFETESTALVSTAETNASILSVHHQEMEDVAFIVEDFLEAGHHVSAKEEFVAEPVLFEAMRKPQESASSRIFAIAVTESDRFHIAEDVHADISPRDLSDDGASVNHICDLKVTEKADFWAHWEENLVEGSFEFLKTDEVLNITGIVPLVTQELEVLNVVDVDFALKAVAAVRNPLVQGDVVTVPEFVSIHDDVVFSTSAVDHAYEKPVEHQFASVSIPIVKAEATLISIVDLGTFFCLEGQTEEASKTFATSRVGDVIEKSFRGTEIATHGPFREKALTRSRYLDSRSKAEETTLTDLMDFLVKSAELLSQLPAGPVLRTTKSEVHLGSGAHSGKTSLRRKYMDEDSSAVHEVPVKRRKTSSIDTIQSTDYRVPGSDSHKEVESVDVASSRDTPKSKRRRSRKKHHESTVQERKVAYTHPPQSCNRLVAAEVNGISEFLESDDRLQTGYSSLSHIESSFIESPDLFGIGEHVKRRSKSKKERHVREEVVTRSKTKALAAAHPPDKPRIVLRIRKSSSGVVIQRVEPDYGSNGSMGFFGKRLLNLVRHLRESRFEKSFVTCNESWPGSSRISRFASDHDLVVSTVSRQRNHLISDFNLTMVKSKNPIVKIDIDTSPLLNSLSPLSPICLSLPRAEGSLEHAVEQFEKGIGCVLEQVDNARTIIAGLRDKMHWSLHFLLDAQMFLLDLLYELWGFTARTVQIAVFSVYQTCLWEKHSELFDARMYCLLFEMNASAALSCNIDTCASYLRRFEEWCRNTGNCTSIYTHVHGLALSLIKLIMVPDILKRLQQKTLWNSKALPSKINEEVFSVDLAPFFQVGACPFKSEEFDLEKVLNARMPLIKSPLEDLIGFGAALDNNRSDAFSYLFPSHAVVDLCRKQIFDEIETYYHNNALKSVLSLSNRHLYILSPIARGYFVSRVTESRAQSHMRNHVMNIEKLIERLNSVYADLKTSVALHNQAEFNYPCGQVVFGFECGTVNVCINKPIPADVPQLSNEAMEEAQRIMGSAVENTIFHPSTGQHGDLSLKSHRMKKSVEAVRKWVASIQETAVDEREYAELQTSLHHEGECMDVVYPSSPARVQVIDDEDDDTEFGSCELPSKKCCDANTVTTVIAGRKIQYTVDCEQGYLKMKTVDSTANDESTDDLTAANTFSTASFNSLDQIETLKIIRSKDTGELDWIAMIQNALDAAPLPETLPRFMLRKESSDYKILDVMKCHEYANHFVHETNEDGEFLDQRKEMREKIKQFQKIDYYERRRNARFEKIKSSTPLEMPRPDLSTLDQFPAYGIWIHQIVLYAEMEKKRLMGLKPIDNVGRCRAARSELIRGFAVASKQRKRSASAVSWLGRTMREHFGDYIELGMSRLQYERAQSGKERDDARGFGSDDVITDYFVSRNNTPTTLMDPAELIENPYAYFRPTNPSRKRHPSPILLESSLVKRFPECPLLAPFGVVDDEPETLYPPYDPNVLTSDDDDDDDD